MSIDQGGPKRHALGVDFGTSNTVAVARWPDGRARPILVDGSPLLPSAVYAEADGQLSAGRDAVYSARLDPARFEPNPKRRVDDGLVLLGDREVPVVDLIAAVMERVAEEWRRTVGPVPTDVTLTCPATWGATRRGLLAEAAIRAGLGAGAAGSGFGVDGSGGVAGAGPAGQSAERPGGVAGAGSAGQWAERPGGVGGSGPRLVAEPVAAATYFAEVLGRDVPIGSVVVVHDFGAGTFDASVVARTAEGFEVMAVDGRDDIGGLDVDAAVVEYLQTEHTDAAWQRITEPANVEERRAQRQLWDDVRVAKERLSRSQSADLVIPLLNLEIHLTRDELESVARPVIEQTVQVTRRLLRWADLPEGRLAGVFLVGGASRIPLVATLLHRELGEAPVVIEQPELVVAEGSILADAALLAAGPAAPGPTAELRLVFDRRNESETVVAARLPVGGASPAGALSLAGSSVDVPAAPDADTTTTPPSGGSPAGVMSMGAAPTSAGSSVAFPESQSGATPTPVEQPRSLSSGAGWSGGVPQSRQRGSSVDDQTTVRARMDGSELPPAVDPWPHALPDQWTPDPDQTAVSDEPSWRPESPSWDAASSAPTSPATGSGRPGTVTGSARPVAPTESRRRKSSTASATRPPSPAQPTVPSPRRQSQDDQRTDRGGKSRSAAARADAARPDAARPSAARPDAARPSAARPSAAGPAAPRPSAARPAPRPQRPRRGNGFLRFLKFMLSLIVLIAVPAAAMILAYSYGTGEPFQDAAVELARDLRDLYNTHIA